MHTPKLDKALDDAMHTNSGALGVASNWSGRLLTVTVVEMECKREGIFNVELQMPISNC